MTLFERCSRTSFQHMLENIHLAVGLFLINDMYIYVGQEHLQTWASKTKIFMAQLLKTDIFIFSNTVNDWYVHSGKLLKSEFLLSVKTIY